MCDERQPLKSILNRLLEVERALAEGRCSAHAAAQRVEDLNLRLDALDKILDGKRKGHVRDEAVTSYILLGRRFGLSHERVAQISRAAMLHAAQECQRRGITAADLH